MTLWTPANLNDGSLELWFDANDSTLSHTGATFNSWTDRANSVVLTSSGGTAPTYTASLLNGLPGLTFSAGGLGNTSTTKALITNPLSIFAVMTMTAANNNHTIFGARVASGTGEPTVKFRFGIDPELIAIGQPGIAESASTQTLAINTPAIAEWVCPALTGGSWGPIQPYITGVTGGSITAITGFSYTQAGVEIGNSSGSDFFVGKLHEEVILNTQASTVSRQLIEGYLAWKWGLQAGLPGGHPYLGAAPLFSNYFATTPPRYGGWFYTP